MERMDLDVDKTPISYALGLRVDFLLLVLLEKRPHQQLLVGTLGPEVDAGGPITHHRDRPRHLLGKVAVQDLHTSGHEIPLKLEAGHGIDLVAPWTCS